MTAQSGLCRTRSENPKTGFPTMRLNYVSVLTGRKTSKRIECGLHVCNINRSHCPNDTDNFFTYDDTSNDEEVVPLSIGVSLVIIVAVLLVLSMIGAALFVVLVKADKREKEWRLRAEAEVEVFFIQGVRQSRIYF